MFHTDRANNRSSCLVCRFDSLPLSTPYLHLSLAVNQTWQGVEETDGGLEKEEASVLLARSLQPSIRVYIYGAEYTMRLNIDDADGG